MTKRSRDKTRKTKDDFPISKGFGDPSFGQGLFSSLIIGKDLL